MNVLAADRILVVGEAIVDVIHTNGSAARVPGGGPANIAVALSQLGQSVDLLTALGRDSDGALIAAHLADHLVQMHPESWSLSRTSTADAWLDGTGSASYSFALDWSPTHLPPQPPLRALHVGSLGAYLSPGEQITREIRNSVIAAEVSFDPNIRPGLLNHSVVCRQTREIINQATIVKMSDEDAAWLWPTLTPEGVIDMLLAAGPRLVALTRGPRAALLKSHQSELISVPSRVSAVVDTVGAGDSFMAGVIDETIRQGGSYDLNSDAVRKVGQWATAVAALVVGAKGAQMPTRSAVQQSLLPSNPRS